MCPTGQDMIHINKGYMKLDLFKSIVDQVASHVSLLALFLNGESTLHPEFSEMVRYAEKHGVKIFFNTNGTTLTTGQSEKILDASPSIVNFSFDGHDQKSYEHVRVGAKFEKVKNNILAFLKLKKEKGLSKPFTTLSIIDMGHDKSSNKEKEDFKKQFRGLVDDIRYRAANSWGDAFANSQKFKHEGPNGPFSPCGRLWGTTAITWDGKVVPCIYNVNNDYVVGDLKKNTLEEIWNSQEYVRLRESMLDGTYLDISPVCNNCIVISNPPILGVPSGLRLSLGDALTNFLGQRVETFLLRTASYLRDWFPTKANS